jgi:hypothetical protein
MLELLIASPEVMNVGRSPLITVGYIFQLLISFGIVIGLIFFAAKYILPKVQLPSAGRSLEILDRLGLEPSVTTYVIAWNEKKYLVIVSNKSATLIDKLESGS